MTDDLRTRIAAAIRAVDDMRVCSTRIKDAVLAFYNYDPSWHPDAWADELADAVIAELVLRQEDRDGRIVYNGSGQPINVIQPKSRYVTECPADE